MNTTEINADLQLIFRDIRQRMEKLNQWEIGFFGDIEDKVNKGYELTVHQRETLDKIYEKATEHG